MERDDRERTGSDGVDGVLGGPGAGHANGYGWYRIRWRWRGRWAGADGRDGLELVCGLICRLTRAKKHSSCLVTNILLRSVWHDENA